MKMEPKEAAQSAPGEDPPDSIERRARMLSYIRHSAFVRIQELSQRFGVSEVTVRSDLDILGRDGGVRRVRGGAVRVAHADHEVVFEARTGAHAEEKRQIARAAVEMIAPGDSIILDVGTTTMAIAHALADRSDLQGVTVFTPGLNVAMALERAIPRLQVVVTGGTLRPQQHSLVEPLGTLILERIRATLAFVGCNGVEARLGVMAVSLPDAALKQALIRAASRAVVVADASKLGQTALVGVCGVEAVEAILTAGELEPSALAGLREVGAVVRRVDRPQEEGAASQKP